ncbi:hypothetical protein GpartN1_g3175.t1 [Galdieria partita]|uniref:Coenzyme F420 hydrogenase n=1 Tax=Galdieria partita TaxID=83374 RepID=A0A9C7PVY3_9RHOD|nr:hypothetical protein GpartN1_g3175.t1 [Galdieria partita]
MQPPTGFVVWLSSSKHSLVNKKRLSYTCVRQSLCFWLGHSVVPSLVYPSTWGNRKARVSCTVGSSSHQKEQQLYPHRLLKNYGGLGGKYDTRQYPAKSLCSHCGLCDTRFIHYVKDSCAFLNQHISELEYTVHGKSRALEIEDQLYFGVHLTMLAARRKQPLPGAQWSGIVTSIATRLLETGKVQGIVCVKNDETDRFKPKPILATTPEEIYASRVNKPTLSPNLSVLDTVEASGFTRIGVIGVGCQVEALRSVQSKLGLEKLYVLGTPCVDNVTRKGLDKFLRTTSSSPDTVVHYEFMQDFRVHFKHDDRVVGGSGKQWTETVPFFGLKTNQLKDIFAPSCLSCFDYVNSLADLVVGYMGAPFGWQWIVVRNNIGKEMLDLVSSQIETMPLSSSGNRFQAVQNSIPAYEKGMTLPMWIAQLLGVVIDKLGPKGLEYARFSIDSHFTRNYLYMKRKFPNILQRHVPEYARRIIEQYKLPQQ